MTVETYETAKANLRDLVKTAMTVFGGVTGVLLAGTPISGYSALPHFGVAWSVASLAMLIAVGLMGWALYILFLVLRPDSVDLTVLTTNADTEEARAVQLAFDRYKTSLLPIASGANQQVDSIATLIALKEQAEEDYDAVRSMSNADPVLVAMFKDSLDALRENLDTIANWCSYIVLRERVTRGLAWVFRIGLAALLAIAIFVLVSSSGGGRDKSSTGDVIVLNQSAAPAGEPPQFSAPVSRRFVFFASGSDRLTTDALARIAEVRDDLRRQPGTGVLIYANTDTTGGDTRNARLAVDRSSRVASLLQSAGGIAPSRIFVTPLATRDLPVVTESRSKSQLNRSVELVVIALPGR